MSKLFSAVASIVVAFIAYAMVGAPASSAADLKIEPMAVRAPKVVWVQVDVPQTKAKNVRINIMTPKVNGERERWQVCTMRYVGLGTYRCGLDVSASTPARSMSGKWLATLTIDRRTVGTVRFVSAR